MERDVQKNYRLYIAILHIVVVINTSFFVRGGREEQQRLSARWFWKFNPAFLHDELDSLVRKVFFQLVEAHALFEVVSRLEFQLLNRNGRLALSPCARNTIEPTCLRFKQHQPTIDPEFSPWNTER